MSEVKIYATKSEIIGWLSCIFIPAIIFQLLQYADLSWAGVNFVVVFSTSLVMWIFRLVPEYVPAVFVILATVLLGLAPESVLLSGFSSESFFLALSVFGLGSVIVNSGIFYRLSLFILLHLPKKVPLLQGLVFFVGALLTPLMTAQSSRLALMAPFLEDLRRSADLKSKGALENSLVCCAYQGAILLSAIFLTGKSSNFVLYGMLSKQMQWQFSWLHWLVAASFPALLLIIIFFIVLNIQFKVKSTLNIDVKRIKKELDLLGSLNINEWVATIGVIALLLGLMTSSIHHISSAWMCFAIFFVLLLLGVLNKKDFKLGINWPFLFYLGAIIGIMRCVQVIGIDEWLIHYLYWLEDVAEYSNILFLMIIFLFGFVGSLVFGTAAAPALLFTILLPMAEHAAINTWLIAFILLMSTESWLFPYQSSYYLYLEELFESMPSFDLTPTLKVNMYFTLIRFGVVICSIPVWHMMEII